MQVARSPITWFAALLLLLSSIVGASLFLKLDHDDLVVRKPGPTDPIPKPIGDGPVSILVIATGERVSVQEFSTYQQCYEAKTAVDVGTGRRVLAQCITK